MEAEEIKKRWKEYIEELYKKELDIHDDVVSHPEPDILECEAKQALGSTAVNKASGWNGIPIELFISLKDDALKVFHSICQQICKAQLWPQDWKRSILIPLSKKSSTKECSNCQTAALISHTDVQAGFRKGRGTRGQSANIHWIIEKAREFQINIYFCFIDNAKAFDCVDHMKLWKFLKEMGRSDHLTCLLQNLYAGQKATVRTGNGTTD